MVSAEKLKEFLTDPKFDWEVVEPEKTDLWDIIIEYELGYEIQNPLLRTVMKCQIFGWSIFPLQTRSKKPYNGFSWAQYQTRPAHQQQISHWWQKKYPDSNIAVTCGSVSNLVVVDIDNESGFQILRAHGIFLDSLETVVSKTNRGKQYFFQYPTGMKVKCKKFEGGEVRSDGNYVIIPPSVHPQGTTYEWLSSPFNTSLAILPSELFKFANGEVEVQGRRDNGQLAETIPVGQRNSTLTSLAGSMRRRGCEENEIHAALLETNKRCEQPLPEREIQSIAKSVCRYPPEHNKTKNKTTLSDSSTVTAGHVTEVVENGNIIRPKVDLKGWLAGKTKYDQQDIVDGILTLDSFEYEAVRLEVAKKLNYRVTKLDKWYDNRNGTSPKEEMSVLPPWPEVVNLGEIASEIFVTLRRYIIMPEESAGAMTLWSCASWVYERFDVFPYLLLSSPTKRCGKTRLLGILRDMVDKGLQAADISSAALFRVVEAERPTLLLDEFDQQPNADDLLNLLNSGNERSGASIRLVGKDFVPKSFSTFCPKIIAMIGKPKDTLVDRSIVVTMQRKKPQDTVERLDQNVRKSLEVVRRKLARWKEDLPERLPEVEPLKTNNDREIDNWVPLLTIAEMASGAWPQRAQEAAKALSKDVEDDSVKIQLLQDIRDIFERQETDRITTSDLLEELKSLEESPWGDWNFGKGLSPRGLAKLVKPFGVESKDIRISDKVLKGYEHQDFDAVFDRYIPSDALNLSATSATTLNPLDLQPLQNATKAENVAAISINKTSM